MSEPEVLPRLLIATMNRGKLREIRALLAGVPIELVDLHDLGDDEEFAEVGQTFEMNAVAKAIHYHGRHGIPTIADDSGLSVDALEGEPGIHSRRFLGEDVPYARKMAEILRRLEGKQGDARAARFTCAVCLAADDRIIATIVKHVFGVIADEPRGDGGFGYDPFFLSTELGQTFGEAPQEEKDRVSHRGQALRSLVNLIETHDPIRALLGVPPLRRH